VEEKQIVGVDSALSASPFLQSSRASLAKNSFHPKTSALALSLTAMTTIEQAPLLPQDVEDGTSSSIPEPELVRPKGITEVKAPRAPARSSRPIHHTSAITLTLSQQQHFTHARFCFPKPVPSNNPQSQAIRTPSLLFISGQMSRDQRRDGGVIRIMQPVDAIEQCMHDISAILAAGGSSFQQVVKVTVYILTDLPSGYRDIFEMVYKAYFEGKPARTVVEVSKLEYSSRIALDVIAMV
jgi:2-iminobutanoate/2-iminopropanoate deaminase